MKLQVFLSGQKGYAQPIADALAEMFVCKCDQIPPAYQCNKEKLVFLVYEKYGKLDKKFVSYLKGLDKNSMENVSLIEISKTGAEGKDEISQILSGNGIHIHSHMGIAKKSGLFKAILENEDIEKAKEFAMEQGKDLFQSLR